MEKNFAYRAKDHSGRILEGTIVAESERAVAHYIYEKGYYVTKIKEIAPKNTPKKFFQKLKGVSQKEIAIFCKQLAVMMDAGVPLITALNILIAQTRHMVLKEALIDICNQVQQGRTLTTTLSMYKNIFPSMMLHTIAAGEVGGILDDVLERLSIHLEKDYKVKAKIRAMLVYPFIVISLAIFVVMFILTFVMPIFIVMFENMKIALPLPTQILLMIGSFFQQYWKSGLSVIIAIGFVLIKLYQLPKYRMIVDKIILKLPVVGMITTKVSIARFTRTLGTLLSGGVPILTALDVGKNVIENRKLVAILSKVQRDVQDGFTLSETLQKTENFFEPMVLQMIVVGEETGNIDIMLHKIADFYESDVDDMIEQLSGLLEPILTIMLGIIVGSIAISIVFPMFDAVTYIAQ